MYVATILGDHKLTADLSLEWQAKIMKLLPAQVNGLETTFISALSCLAVVRTSPMNSNKYSYLRQAKLCQGKIKSWVSKSCPNCVAHSALLEAESYALKKNNGMAMQSFESAVLLAGRRGLIHVQALANERLGIFLQEIGEKQDSRYRWKEALKLYREWGATAKVQQVRELLAMESSEL